MPKTYEPISSTTLGTATASVTFSSIPQTYTDLIIVGNLNTTASLDYWYRLNSDTGSNYNNNRILGNGTTPTAFRATNQTINYLNANSTTGQHSFITHFMNYSNTTTYKTQLTRYGNASLETVLRVNLWRNTAAISTILIQTDSSTFTSGSTFTLYGIKAA
jgi:hypothetical protein